MNVIKSIFLVFFILTKTFSLFGQLSTDHWISPIHSRSTNEVEDHYIYLSTPISKPFLVEIKDGSGAIITTQTISKNNPARVLIGTEQPSKMFLELSDLNSIQKDKGLILKGSSPFYVSFRVRSLSQAGYLTSKGKIGTGERFRLLSFPQNGDTPEAFRNFYASVMATENNTTVTFSEYNPNVEFATSTGTISPNVITVILNEGETYTVSGYTDVVANYQGFVGALVTSDKPITVNTGNALGSISKSRGGQDYGIDQIVPENIIGQEYVVIEGAGSPDLERPIVVATKDNTAIFVNDNTLPLVTINAGDFFEIDNSFYKGNRHQNMYITMSKPAYLFQALAGSQLQTTSGMNFLPPLNCLLLTEVDLIASLDEIGDTKYSGDIIAITRKGAVLSINGNPVSQSPEDVLGTSEWETYRIGGLNGDASVSSTGALSVGLFGFNGNAGFGGYYSGFGFDGQNIDLEICQGIGEVNILKQIPGSPLSGGIWNPAFNSGTNIFDPDIDGTGTYNYILPNDCAPLDIDVNINVLPPPRIGSVSLIELCDANSDGVETFNLEPAIQQALDGQDKTNFEITFFKSREDALSNTNEIGTSYQNSELTETLFAKITSVTNPLCFNITSFQVKLNQGATILIKDNLFFCAIDSSLEVTANPNSDRNIWNRIDTLGNRTQISNKNSVNITEDGMYELIQLNDFVSSSGITTCTNKKVFNVSKLEPATIVNFEKKEVTTNNSVQINISGNGMYEFSIQRLDQGSFSTSFRDANFFDKLSPGDYKVTINEKSGCGTTSETFNIAGFAPFFTPNGDGINDSWGLKSASNEFNDAQIFIFNRYGKLIIQLFSFEEKWDGTYKGNPLPSSEYWYRFESKNKGISSTGHFMLKR